MSDQGENKCDACGLRVKFNQRDLSESTTTEDFFRRLRALQSQKIVPKGWPRVINASIGTPEPDDSSEICAINHSSWRKNRKKCPHWQPSIGLSLGEYLSLHEARKMEALTKDIHKLTAIAVTIPIGYLALELYKWAS
ncbi:MAG: hypothetical protein KUG79_00220 [Pseudomonadales bacterium]|nr:hypothetical protein [Pseudomonadales bacterium]